MQIESESKLSYRPEQNTRKVDTHAQIQASSTVNDQTE